MPILAVTANLLMGVALYVGVIAALYGGTDVAASLGAGSQAPGEEPEGGR